MPNDCVSHPKRLEYKPRFAHKTVIYGGGNIMLKGTFSCQGIGPLVRISNKMRKFKYWNILKCPIPSIACKLNGIL